MSGMRKTKLAEESPQQGREGAVIGANGKFYTLRKNETGGGMRLAAHRLYATAEEAQAALEQIKRNNGGGSFGSE